MWNRLRQIFYKKQAETRRDDAANSLFLRRYFGVLAVSLFIALTILIPYSCIWLYSSGDAAVERAVESQARGDFALFGSALSQDFVDYKLRLYAATKPEIIAIGSSRVMQFRGAWFTKPFLNMGGVAGNLAILRSTINALLAEGKPGAAIIGLDFWWFLPQWEKYPFQNAQPTEGSYNYSLASLKTPWRWLFEGKISLAEFAAPVLGMFGAGFRANRYGIMAQRADDGFGPDGSWYYTSEITGQNPPFDFKFRDTLSQVENGIKAFYYANANQKMPDERHIDAFAEIWCKLKTRGIETFVFIPPFAPAVYKAMRDRENQFPHLFHLREMLAERGIEVMDFSDARAFASNDCEFVDGFHGGEVAYARILQRMADHWPALLAYVNMDALETVIRDWRGNALVANEKLTDRPEVDFMEFGCKKGKYVQPPPPPEEPKPAPPRKSARKIKK